MRKDDFRDFVLEQLGGLRGLDCEALYSGYGLRCDKTLFAVISNGRLYFRVHDDTRPDYQAARAATLLTRGGIYKVEYLEVPSAVQKDPELLLEWAEKSIAGLRETKKGRKRKIRFR